ncbi:MAG: hypothetical protein KatS3mg005_0437 [Bryobacteraceae bacterium]|nr:MAG: hypothetical protein KatS3mg005_0437 [Bryobacteraceae bacterium]
MAETRKTRTQSKAAAEGSAPKRAARSKAPAATHAGEQEARPRASATRKAAPRRSAAQAFDPQLHHEEIAREAYLLWLGRGMAHGHDQEDWFRATEIVRARYTPAPRRRAAGSAA